MKAHMAAAAMCAALAGCAGCGDVTYDLSDKSVVPSRRPAPSCTFPDEKAGRSEVRQTGQSWGIAKLIKAPVEDMSGTKVAEIDDLLVSPDGRINTAVLTVTNGGGDTRTITVAFKDLKRSVDAEGNYTIRTTQLKERKRQPEEPDMRPSAKDAPAKDSGK